MSHCAGTVQAPAAEKGGKKERDPCEGLKLAVLQTLDPLLRLPRDRAELATLLACARESDPDSCNPDDVPELSEGAPVMKSLPLLAAQFTEILGTAFTQNLCGPRQAAHAFLDSTLPGMIS